MNLVEVAYTWLRLLGGNRLRRTFGSFAFAIFGTCTFGTIASF